jgi:SAM-dependent methyltransferase
LSFAAKLLASADRHGKAWPMTTLPPTIFSAARRSAVRRRMHALQQHRVAARYIAEDMAEDVLERLAFLRHEPARALVEGDITGTIAAALTALGCDVVRADPQPARGEIAIDEELPRPFSGAFDLCVNLGSLATVNDLPGALVHLRAMLAPGGLAMLCMLGAGSLPGLRKIMFAADGAYPAARMHPQVDVRAGGQLLQRTGFADPVVDSRTLDVRFGSLARLVEDLREQGLGNCLASQAPPLGKAGLRRAQRAFAEAADADGRMTERFEILTLSGWARTIRPPKF